MQLWCDLTCFLMMVIVMVMVIHGGRWEKSFISAS
jgi:hypothetical protein